MRKTALAAVAAAIVMSGPAAAGMTTSDYQSARTSIEGDYQLAKGGCGKLAAHPKDVCMAEARGKEKVALAELGVAYKRRDAVDDRHDRELAAEKRKCDVYVRSLKEACVNDARARYPGS